MSARRRLDSWKEIALFLKRSVRTVQRWEGCEQLPIYRHRHQDRSSVFTYADELELWQQQRTTPSQQSDSARRDARVT
jgi:hypothetical protein